MRREIERLGIKGSVLVIRGGKTLLNYATRNTTDTSYLINSVQKSFTAALVMKEVQDHKLRLNDNLAHFYPTLPGAKKIKVKNLLTMTSGLTLLPGQKLGRKNFISDVDNIVEDINKTAFYAPGLGKWKYSSLNYVYLCGILMTLEHKSYEQVFKDYLVEPLGLKQVSFLWASPAELAASGLADGYVLNKGRYKLIKRKVAVKAAHDELGAGSVVMPNYDLAKILHYVLAGKLLTRQSRKLLYHGQEPMFYAGGLYNYSRYKTANGAGVGYYTFVRTSSDGQNMIIVQSNRTKKGNFVIYRDAIDHVMQELLKDK